ncbi:MAG: diversity-generating retroelement protein Avd [Planctomycetes bacterium]|nr:diversity-generating retroelement protein Avd [Planctomycetota bacterium]
MNAPWDAPSRGPQRAGEELLVLQKWEEFTSWLLLHTAKWPKSCRFTLAQRLENHALDIVEALVSARYDPRGRLQILREVNLRLERMRFLFRIARDRGLPSARSFEAAMRAIDEAGRMLHGWRQTLEVAANRSVAGPAAGSPSP